VLLQKYSRNLTEVCPKCQCYGVSIDWRLELKRTPVVIGQLLWQPFDNRFSNFLKRLQFHYQVFESEMAHLHSVNTQNLVEGHKQELQKLVTLTAEMEVHSKFLDEMKQALTSEQKGSSTPTA
jgi:hypothetical protein